MLLDPMYEKHYYKPLIQRKKNKNKKCILKKRLFTVLEVIEWHVRFTMVPVNAFSDQV